MTIYKGYIVKPQKNNPRGLTVAVEGRGGKIPDVLSGIFTSMTVVYAHIDAYLNSRPAKAAKKDTDDASEEIKPG